MWEADAYRNLYAFWNPIARLLLLFCTAGHLNVVESKVSETAGSLSAT